MEKIKTPITEKEKQTQHLDGEVDLKHLVSKVHKATNKAIRLSGLDKIKK